ncbi:MAG: outer membrane beta-barrel protein, partial [candidate division WOR-3 bacterium]
SLCLSGQTGRTRRHYQFDLGADGIYHIFQSNYQSHDKWLESNLWARVNFNIARFFITGRIGVNNYQFKELSLEPQLETRYTITDSLTISLVIRRVCQRAGYIATNFAADTTMGLKIKGNPDLKPEIHSQGRIGLSYRQLFISFYQSHCDRPIRMILDNQGYQKLENCNSVKSYGVFGTASLCCLKYLSLYGGGNYSSRDSGRYYLIGGEVLYDLETVSFRGRYEQTFINQPVHSLMFGLRFLDFHLYLWIDNLFNTELIPAQPRAFLFGIFWNFLN